MWSAYLVKKRFEIDAFYSAFDRVCKEGFMFKGESHDFWELVYVMEGSILVSADEQVVKLSKNQLLFHQPMEFHTQRIDEGGSAHIFILSFSATGDFMERYGRKIFHLKTDRRKELMEILTFLRDYYHIKGEAPSPVAFLQCWKTDLCFSQKLTNMTENFLINLSTAQSEENLVVSSETRIYRDAMNLIDESVCENLTVLEIAKRCNVSEAYLKKIFAKYTGRGVHNCVLKTKIAAAKQLLDSGMSVSQVAEKLSFSTPNYFSIVFRRETGISPMEYKKR